MASFYQNKMPFLKENNLKNRTLKNKEKMSKKTWEEKLDNLFSEGAEPSYQPVKIVRKLEKLDLTSLGDTPEEPDLELELQEIINAGSFKDYLPTGIKFGSKSVYEFEEKVMREYVHEETYDPDVEDLLKVHLQFPSKGELEDARSKAPESLKLLFKVLKESKGSYRLYYGLQFYRMAVLASVGLVKYVAVLSEIVAKMKKIILSKVEGEMECTVLLDRFLTTFERRILKEGNYLNCSHRDFEKQHLSLALELYHQPGEWTPVDHDQLIRGISPYELMFFPLKEVLSRLLTGKYPRYISDRGVYFYLSTVTYGKRIWLRDAYLDTLAVSLENIIPGCFTLYERYYMEYFPDRSYHVNLDQDGTLGDLSVLLNNMKILSNRKRCSEYLRKHLSEKLSYNPNGKFDVLGGRNDASFVLKTYEGITQDDIDRDFQNLCKRLYSNYVIS